MIRHMVQDGESSHQVQEHAEGGQESGKEGNKCRKDQTSCQKRRADTIGFAGQ